MKYKCVKFHKSISKVLSMRVDQSQILKNSEKNGLEPRTSQLDRVKDSKKARRIRTFLLTEKEERGGYVTNHFLDEQPPFRIDGS